MRVLRLRLRRHCGAGHSYVLHPRVRPQGFGECRDNRRGRGSGALNPLHARLSGY